MKKWIYIIDSMTEEEVRDPSLIDRSRMKRIAMGSGTSVVEVKQFLDYYENINRFLRNLRRRGLPAPLRKLEESAKDSNQ
jgi:signal recognition particle subunit SRP54